ncbi:hypothetical protein EHF_0873 [Ehrlichia japonica]|uniref:Uncharacterized protein n=1 Tax=Ehrlichia japonica TaxID=391036 RepID=X5GIV8_9RICK|nr:hypothetical protein EHF_0873 [Ehrlichia japonica]
MKLTKEHLNLTITSLYNIKQYKKAALHELPLLLKFPKIHLHKAK